LASSNATIINPLPFEPGTEGIYPLRIQTTLATIYDSNNGPGQLELGTLSFINSTMNDSYLLGNQSFLKGSVSSLALGYFSFDGSNTVSSIGSLFLSSIFLGAFGGTVSGELTTDETATNLYWKGTQLNGGGGGGGVSLQALQSTVGGLATASYVSTLTLAQSISSFSTTLGPGGGVTAAQLTSTATRWATYPAVSSIVFANDVASTRNEIVSPGFTFFNLVNELGVLATTSSTTEGIYPSRSFIGAGLTILDQFDLINPGNINYNYSIVAGQSYTGTVSSLAIVDTSFNTGPLYLSSLYFGNYGGVTTGQLTTDATATNLFYNTNQLANLKVGVVVSTLGLSNPQFFSEDIGKYFLFTQSNAGTTVYFPTADSNLNGWNVVIKNMEGSSNSFTLNTIASNVLAPGVVTTVVCDGISFYSL
jgi:hypothetical protein